MLDENKRKQFRDYVEIEKGLKAEANLERLGSLREMITIAKQPIRKQTSQIIDQIHKRLSNLSKPYAFIDKDFVDFKITDEDVVMINAASGRGKSTIAANIVTAWIDSGNTKEKPLLYIANEESSNDVMMRLAALRIGMSYTQLSAGNGVTREVQERIDEEVRFLESHMDVIANDLAESEYSSCQVAEGLNHILETAYGKYSAVVVDYYQAITATVSKANAEPFEAQSVFVGRIDTHRIRLKCPMFVFAQSKPLKVSDQRSNFQQERQMGRKSIYEKATIVLEVQKASRAGKKNTEANVELAASDDAQATILFIHKARYNGMDGQSIVFRFDRGRYIYRRILSRDQTDLLP